MASSLFLRLLSFLLLFLLLPNFSSPQTSGNISLGTSLSTQDKNPYWVSASGEFAFGFYSIKGNLFLLAVWFAQIPLKTTVWTAKTDLPIERGSKLRLTGNGVSLTNSTDGEIWISKIESSNGAQPASAASAAMLDNGNFVLRSNDATILWGTFDEPTDTILPGQKLERGSNLLSQTSEEDRSPGRFQLFLKPDGNLVLQPIARPTKGAYDNYWTSNTADTRSQLVFNETGDMYLTASNGTLYNITNVNPVSSSDFYQRATIDFDGVFRKYTYPKNSNSQSESWSVSWSVPPQICTSITGDVGSGACGFNSYCVLGEDQRPDCVCPPGYDYLDPSDRFKGCKQTFAPQSCNKDNFSVAEGFKMEELINTDWPKSDYEHFVSVNEDWCKNTCLNDCFCAVSIIRGNECWLKKIPLSNGRRDASVQGKAQIKVGNSSLQTVLPTLPPQQFSKGKKESDNRVLPGAIILGSSLFLNLLLLVIPLAFYMRHKRSFKAKPDPAGSTEGNLRFFTYKQLEQATNGFKEELGKGAFSTVYKGVLDPNAGSLIAVKKLEKIVQEVDKEFKAEVKAIGRTNHKNLVRLIGFCDEETHRLLVYEFMSNGSLANFLFGNTIRPSWYRRIQIAYGIARGLAYLHEECSTQIIHCDVKPQNVLIDESFTARISDFGLAKLLKNDQTRTSTGIRGTRGYVAPEWFKSNAITAKVDVYSFGIMLMEIIFCRRNVEQLELGENNTEILSECVYDAYAQGQLHSLLGDDEEAKSDGRRMERMVMVAIWCVQDDPALRPSMRKVTQMLEGAADVPKPPDPFAFVNSIV